MRSMPSPKLSHQTASLLKLNTSGWLALWIMIWDTSIWIRACWNRWKILSAQKCYPCSRYVLLLTHVSGLRSEGLELSTFWFVGLGSKFNEGQTI
jgi:hypothetical protein